MRVTEGSEIKIFDGLNGEWWCKLLPGSKLGCSGKGNTVIVFDFVSNCSYDCFLGVVTDQVRQQVAEPNLWLLFAPVKGAALDTIIQKATELGKERALPCIMNDMAHRLQVSRASGRSLRSAPLLGVPASLTA